jgi:hypothetical protein
LLIFGVEVKILRTMKDKYNLETDQNNLIFEFFSEGPKGKILKIVEYQQISGRFYNLAFGDSIENSIDFDDFVRTNNDDVEKVLATVASTLYIFFEHYEGTIVIAEGSTHSRTRLYRKYMTLFLEFIEKEFILLGELDGKTERFRKGVDYKFFLIRKKI